MKDHRLLPDFSIGLGTVQIGLPYGNNADGSIMSEREAFDILSQAVKSNIVFWDTAMAYGAAEARIGKFISQYQSTVHDKIVVSTKLPRVDSETWSDENLYYRWMVSQLDQSRSLLGVSSIGLLQFHQCDLPFLKSMSVRKAIDRLLSSGIVGDIGVSVYSVEEAVAANEHLETRWLQVPVSLVDRRFVEAGFIDFCRDRKVSLIARSVLLQGVLVDDAPLPNVKKRSSLGRLRSDLISMVKPFGLTLHEASLRYMTRDIRSDLRVILIGCDSFGSLVQNISVIGMQNEELPAELDDMVDRFSKGIPVQTLLNPAKWSE
jgi:aryl-alcohol dehydrogenase-like predicted oxidoreductase